MNQKDFGLRLKELRLSHSLTQNQLAKKIEISRQAYLNYESGRTCPPAEIIAKLSNILGTNLMEMLYPQTTLTYSDSKTILSSPNRQDYFSLLESYSNLPPLIQKRVLHLINIMAKGGDS